MAEKGVEKRGLGRGLSALMGDMASVTDLSPDAPASPDKRIPIENIVPNPDQPRRRFEPEALEELAASIRERGILQPLIVRPKPDTPQQFEIVAGERRWRAAQMARLHDVPVLVREFSDEEAMEVAIIENIQRDDLNAVEEAQGYDRLMKSHGRTQEELGQALGKSRSHVANMIRLLGLPEEVLEHLAEGRISAGHARALVTSSDPVAHARIIIAKGLNVREAEKLAKGAKRKNPPPPRPPKDPDTRAIEDELSASVGVKVRIEADASGTSGQVVINYKSLDELDDLCRRLSNVRAGSL